MVISRLQDYELFSFSNFCNFQILYKELVLLYSLKNISFFNLKEINTIYDRQRAYIYKILVTRYGIISRMKVNSSDAMWKVETAVFNCPKDKMKPKILLGFKFYEPQLGIEKQTCSFFSLGLVRFHPSLSPSPPLFKLSRSVEQMLSKLEINKIQ